MNVNVDSQSVARHFLQSQNGRRQNSQSSVAGDQQTDLELDTDIDFNEAQ